MCQGISEADYRKKSFDLTIDSLKLYITLATFAFAGMLAFFNATKNPVCPEFFYISIFSFFLCAVVAVIIINMFIVRTFKQDMDPMKAGVRLANGLAIVLFGAGFVFAAFFILAQPPRKEEPTATKVVIEQDQLRLSVGWNAEYTLEVDSVHKTKTLVLRVAR